MSDLLFWLVYSIKTFSVSTFSGEAHEVTSDDKLWALLSFLLTPLIPLIVILMEDKKNRPFLKHHAVPTLIEGIILWIITIIPVVGWILGPIGFIVINILMGIKAYKGEYVNIPVITNFCKNQNWI